MNRKTVIGLCGAAGVLAACVTVAQPPVTQEPDQAAAPEAVAEDAAQPARKAPGGHPADVPIEGGVVVGDPDLVIDETGFAVSAFPPTMPNSEWHQEAWERNDCMRCHETGVGTAPTVRHIGMPAIALVSKCRTCHVIEPDRLPTGELGDADEAFLPNAFPPMIPNSISHGDAWVNKDCLMCHEDGVRDAPIVVHKGLPRLTLQSKCRTCHVQVRADEADRWDKR